MKSIQIEVPEGKVANQENKNGSIIVTFKDKPNGDILDRINSVEDALNEAEEQTKQDYLKAIGGYTTPDRVAEEDLKLIIKVVNEGTVFDYANTNQKKWFPVFKYSPGSGFVFTFSFFNCGYSFTFSGSRLCFSTEKQCETIAKRFIEKYNRMLL
jgi:hypothetical protein